MGIKLIYYYLKLYIKEKYRPILYMYIYIIYNIHITYAYNNEYDNVLNNTIYYIT